jgi:hypothetical protein
MLPERVVLDIANGTRAYPLYIISYLLTTGRTFGAISATLLRQGDSYTLPTTGLEMTEIFGLMVRIIQARAPTVPLETFYKYRDWLRTLFDWLDPRACSLIDTEWREQCVSQGLPPWPLTPAINTRLCLLASRFPADSTAICQGCLRAPHGKCNIAPLRSRPNRNRDRDRDRDRRSSPRKLKIKVPRGVCKNFNFGHPCVNSPCTFKHVCAKCAASHSYQSCPNK